MILGFQGLRSQRNSGTLHTITDRIYELSTIIPACSRITVDYSIQGGNAGEPHVLGTRPALNGISVEFEISEGPP